MSKERTDKDKRLSDALATGIMGVKSKPVKVTTENIKKHKAYDHFINGLHLNITQIKALLNAPSLYEAKKLEAKMPKSIPRFAAWQVRMNWGYMDERIEHCFVCNKALQFHEDEDKGLSRHLGSSAVYFRTSGNWPSTVLDLEDETVEMLVCDDCVKKRKNRMFIIREKTKRVRKTYSRISFADYREDCRERRKKIAKKMARQKKAAKSPRSSMDRTKLS